MISEEDTQKIIEAKNCKTCLDWHHHCKSECCKIVFLDIDVGLLDNKMTYVNIRPKNPLNFSDIQYFRLRDVDYTRGCLRFKKDRIVIVGRRVLYVYPCKLLDGLLCKGHPDNKPEMCRQFTEKTFDDPDQTCMLTDNCLFRYKEKEVEEDVEEGKN